MVDDWQRTTAPGVLAAGDGTGVEGAYVAADEGRLAAVGAALDLGRLTPEEAARRAAPARARLARRRAFQRALRPMHRVGVGIHELSTPETVVCRCEVVTRGEIDEAVRASDDLGVVKGLTRAGMGLCQGRNCQRHVAARVSAVHGVPIGDVPLTHAALPARPVALGALADATIEDAGFFH